ncbi:YfiR family protein [Pelagicoccus enzymogenes]|uniref:YfiR family protein n=1 Tax=Pelagicoccus enzymogenes TaxID=2773457 RepID=UPI00280DDFC8|nr:YfiR family protein [Pelagicoccus enzymogenes]MDQ8200588.1 YfiR family protein [Pelagicoccus enzymogenes]
MRYRTYKLLAAVATLLLTLVADCSLLQAQTLQIDSSTANWIEGFADFVRWEGEENSEMITIGVIGAPEVASYLERRALSRTSTPRIKVAILSPHDSFRGVDILYIGGSQQKHWETIFAKCKGNQTLSISSQDGFVEAGGCVEFVVRRNRLRFYIASEHAKACDVTISSKLLELAIEPKAR